MKAALDVVTVTLNPAIDQTVSIDAFTVGQVNRASEVQCLPAGKGVNAASVLADYGLRVGVTGFLGRENVEPFEALFARKKIEDRFIRMDGRTRVGIKIVDPIRRETTDINFAGPEPTAEDLAGLHRQIETMEAAWFVLAGSLPPGVDVSIYRDLVTRIKSRGSKVALDTSGPSLGCALDAGPDLIKPNIHELEELLGVTLERKDDVIAAARQLVARGIELVVISMGADGACYITRDEALVARPPVIEVRSTVGAGDAMVAGTVAARLRGFTLEECARLGTAFSLEALSRIDSGLSLPAVEDARPEITIDRVKS